MARLQDLGIHLTLDKDDLDIWCAVANRVAAALRSAGKICESSSVESSAAVPALLVQLCAGQGWLGTLLAEALPADCHVSE
eukprot:6021896-Amphidinium_carterae.1